MFKIVYEKCAERNFFPDPKVGLRYKGIINYVLYIYTYIVILTLSKQLCCLS